jgi:hypothetical protein
MRIISLLTLSLWMSFSIAQTALVDVASKLNNDNWWRINQEAQID